ncbi:hypothetical protein Ahy_A07g033031 [Arachis hypogaea]|uniref:Aminotransferase-like plant mobile domain-containing protein n=1 Tax=Arachis hypogaea TaxID=3818 RepID=A0A445C815_ARAHY|nr:hypothetical protein Ahy_A07g033031 [Arachis hypogaea]
MLTSDHPIPPDRKSNCRGSCIKLTWLRDLKENLQLTDENSIQRTPQFSTCKHVILPYIYPVSSYLESNCVNEISGITGSVETDAIDILRLLTLGRPCMIFRKARFSVSANLIVIVIVLVIVIVKWIVIKSLLYFFQFVWVAYAIDRVDPDIISVDIYMHLVVWSATVPLMSFECIEWHATDRYRRQFSFVQGVPYQERNLDKAHGEVLAGPKNLN